MKTMKEQTKNAVMIILGIAAIAITLSLTGCGKGDQGDTGAQGPQGAQGIQGPTGPAASPSPVADSDIADVLENGAHGNAYRLGLGQTELSPGLSCQVVHVSAGQCLSNSTSGSAACVGQPTVTTTGTTYTYLYDGAFDQPSSPSGATNLLPTAIQSLFVGNNYRIICQGQLVVTTPGWYSFEDQSDDGSIIYLDGATLYNDGNHALNTTPVTQAVYFTRDVHSFQVQYAQTGGGAFGLILTSGGAQIPAANLFH